MREVGNEGKRRHSRDPVYEGMGKTSMERGRQKDVQRDWTEKGQLSLGTSREEHEKHLRVLSRALSGVRTGMGRK